MRGAAAVEVNGYAHPSTCFPPGMMSPGQHAPLDERESAVDRSRDWLMQAERDLEQAGASRDDQRHEWACFAAQQSAEKAVKALHLYLGQEAWGHVVARLLAELPVEVDPSLVEKAKVLDNF